MSSAVPFLLSEGKFVYLVPYAALAYRILTINVCVPHAKTLQVLAAQR